VKRKVGGKIASDNTNKFHPPEWAGDLIF